MASGDWTEEEQQLLEDGLLQAASVCNPREKWQAIAKVVGTRDARACAERYRVCRAQALQVERQRREAEEQEAEEDEEEAEDEEDQEDQDGEEGAEGEGVAEAARGGGGGAASSSSASGYPKGRRDWKGSWWSQDWRSSGGGKGSRGGWSWDGGWSWQGTSWGAAGEDGAAAGSSADPGNAWEEAKGEQEEDLSGLDERQRRALEMRREVEANRERLRLKQEREEQDRLRREQKKADELAERDKKRQEQQESMERQIQERAEQQRLRKFLEEQEAKAVMAKAAQFNPGGAPARMVGGREAKPTIRDWSAKAKAGAKGLLAKQRRQEQLEKQAQEALANIAQSKGQASKKPDSEEEDEEEEEEPPPRAPPARRAPPGPPVGPVAPPPAKSAAAPPPKAPAAKAKASAPAEPRKRGKKRWWAKLDGDCPISLAPLGELPNPPFGLEAEGSSNMHYFDARFLASFLLSSCDFIDPVNRRPLTHNECAALDAHLKQHYPEVRSEASVADAFALFEKHGARDASQVHAVQREATAVLQHLFRFGSARRTDRRGRAIEYADAGLTVVDDDDILAPAGNASSSAAPAEPDLERMTSADFPHLDGEGGGPAGAGGRGGWGGKGRPQGGRGSGEAFPALASAKGKAKAWGPPSKVGSPAKAKSNAPGRGGKGRGRGNTGRADAW